MRKRVDQLGVAEPEIQQSGKNQIDVALPDVSNLQEAIKQVGTVAQLAFYDWEINVIGPDGKPDPTNPAVTGGSERRRFDLAGRAVAVRRAPARDQAPAKIEPNNARDGNLYYAVDKAKKHVFGTGEESRAAALAKVPQAVRDKAEVLVVKPDTVIVRAQQRRQRRASPTSGSS